MPDLLGDVNGVYFYLVVCLWWVARIDMPRALLIFFAPSLAEMLVAVECWFEELI